jgi:Arc/MetJ-type ribon-helix-helix transcriptional regulator
MALVYTPTKLDQKAIEKIDAAIGRGKYRSRNAAINTAVNKFFNVKQRKKK